MRFIKILVCLFLIFAPILSSYAQGKTNVTDSLGRKQGRWVKYDKDRKKVYEGNFLNDVPVGKFTYYLTTGTPWAITTFMHNGTVGYTQHLNAQGKITGEGKYIEQQKDSLWKYYDESGKLKAEENYLKGKKNGKSKVYYGSGQVAEDNNWSNDVLDGTSTKYFESGQIKSQRQYVKGSVEGKATYNYPTGKTYAEGAYKNDIKTGVWNFYNEDGTLKKKATYINGKSKDDQLIMTKEEEDMLRKKYEQSESNDSGRR